VKSNVETDEKIQGLVDAHSIGSTASPRSAAAAVIRSRSDVANGPRVVGTSPSRLLANLNTPGAMLKFAREGWQGASTDPLESFMNAQRERCFIPVAKRTRKPEASPESAHPATVAGTRR
jgi:hypothetical protein